MATRHAAAAPRTTAPAPCTALAGPVSPVWPPPPKPSEASLASLGPAQRPMALAFIVLSLSLTPPATACTLLAPSRP